MSQPNICPICGTPRQWKVCNICQGAGYIDAHTHNPLKYDPGQMQMCCDQCYGIGGWYQCPNHNNHLSARARLCLCYGRQVQERACLCLTASVLAQAGSGRQGQAQAEAEAGPTETDRTASNPKETTQ